MRKHVASCSALLIAAGLLAGCGGSSSKTGADGATVPTDAASNDGSDGSSDFAKLVEDAGKERFKITFTIGDDSDSTIFAQDGKGNSTYTSGDSQFFTTPDGSVSCSTSSGGEAECTKVAGGLPAINPFLSLATVGKTYIEQLGDKLDDKDTKTIAGRKASCVTFSAKDFGGVGAAIAAALKGSATYCVDEKTGVLLEVSGTDDDDKETHAFTATKYEEPSDSDFELPAEPKDATQFTLPPGVTLPPGITLPNQ